MDPKNLPDIVETIKKNRISPTPRWIILARNAAFWATLGAMGVIGTIFLSLGLIDVLDIGPDVFRSLGFRRFPFFLFLSTPPVWILLFCITVVFGALAFRNTRRGYRYRALFVGGLITLSILTLSLLAHFAKVDERIDQAFEDGTPSMFRGILPPRVSRWSSPQNGALAGRVVESETGSFLLKTESSELWTVLVDSRTKKSPMVDLESGESILVLGNKSDNHIFQALLIRPLRDGWRPQGTGSANSREDAPYKDMRGAHDRFPKD